jgi:hypothetical protein
MSASAVEPTGGTFPTRDAFTRHVVAERARARRRRLRLAAVSVPLGLAQLVMIPWLDARMTGPARLWIEGGVFVLYMVVVMVLIWHVVREDAAAAVRCAGCGHRLDETSTRIAMASGRCDACGASLFPA